MKRAIILTIMLSTFAFCAFAAQVGGIKPAHPVTTAPAVQLPGHPKTAPKKPSLSHAHPLKPKTVKALPDLVVEKIWLDSQNSIHCTLKNRGKGSLAKANHGRGKLKISCCRQVKIFGLRSVDPGHALLKPHGEISFNTHLKMTCTDNVEGKIFFTGKLPGAITKNSRLTVRLQPKLIRKSEKTTARKSFHTPSALQTQLSKKPELYIQKISLKKGTIHIFIKGNGFGRLSKKDYGQGMVVLNYSGKTKSWRLKDVDPRGNLNKPGKKVLFDTGINLNKIGVVKVSIEKVKMHSIKIVRLIPEKAFQTPLSALPGTWNSAGIVPLDLDISLAKPREPLSNLSETHKTGPLVGPAHLSETGHQVYYPGLDITIYDEHLAVEFENDYIRIHYFCDPGIYQGPVEFNLKVYRIEHHQCIYIVNETFVDQDSADLFAGIPFTWEWGHFNKLHYEVTVNPNHKLYETNYTNNQRTGYLYKGGVAYIDRISSPFLPELQDGPGPQSIVRTRWWVHNAIIAGSCWYYDPYDSDTNMLFIDVSFDIMNPSPWTRTVHKAISCASMDGPARYEEDVRVEAGGRRYLTTQLGINMQDENYIMIQLDGRIYLNLGIEFRGLPYDPTASLAGPLSVSPNRRLVSAATGGIVRYIVAHGDSPWHITTDDPVFSPHPDTLTDDSHGLKDENGNYYFYVVIPSHSTPKIVNYTITDSTNHTVRAKLFIVPPQY